MLLGCSTPSSYSTTMLLAKRLTFTELTPCTWPTALSTAAEQAEQVIPVTANFSFFILVHSPLHPRGVLLSLVYRIRVHPVKAFHPGATKKEQSVLLLLGVPGLESAHQFDAGFEGFCTRAPLGRANLVAVFGHVLGSLHLAQELGGITADAVVVDFIGNDSTLGVDDETAAQGHAFILDVNSEIPAQFACGIGQHGVLDPLNSIRRIMPGFVHKVAVRGNGIDLRTRLLELLVQVCQIAELRGADKGEVSGVEHEDRPLTQYVCLAYILELSVVKCLDFKVIDLSADQRHAAPPCNVVIIVMVTINYTDSLAAVKTI